MDIELKISDIKAMLDGFRNTQPIFYPYPQNQNMHAILSYSNFSKNNQT